ncbi:uncharacterized protein LOC124161243 [Ischnura elegans]|uniref:uncharacterized protein LOC124161243 n=1 Tax=Ischnura elegans TaxID=197161 RepID=UPI001ED87FC6|nr:uncharacterized protein LOC124161243 [Ischnura elegans]XP_046393477.1 uncharacterized protein LOC124161243 [Ischnura elegans]
MDCELKNPLIVAHEDSVHIWWFPEDFTQERIGEKSLGSNACTVIILLVAQTLHELADWSIEFEENSPFQFILIQLLKNSIRKGNELYKSFRKENQIKAINLNIPESISAIGPEIKDLTEWQTSIYLMDLGDTLFNNLVDGIKDWESVQPPYNPELYVILIAGNHSVLWVFQDNQNKVLLIDTHGHNGKGAVVASVYFSELKSLCHWYHSQMLHCYNSQPKCYELTYFYFRWA